MTRRSKARESGSRGSRRRLLMIIGAVSVALIAFVLIYFEPQAAFFDDTVHEALPGLDEARAAPPTTSTISVVPAITAPAISPAPDATTVSTSAAAPEPAVATTTTVAPTPAAAAPNSLSGALGRARDTNLPVIVSSGTFISGEHETTGTALVVALPDGSVVVRFEDLDTSNGPDLRVVVSPDPASDAWQYDGRVHLGELKGNVGDQNYTIDDGIDLTTVQSVVIWCERFSVAFGAAPLSVSA